jgi:hypothetical protein
MAEGLEEIVQKVLLEGDIEVIKQLGEIGEKGFETFHEIAEAAEHGVPSMQLFATSVALVATALVGATAAVAAWVEGQAEAIQQTSLLAKAMGTTTQQVTALEAAFAQAGVSVTTFETFAQRLTTTIAREWPAISASIRTAANEQAAAQERVIASTLRVQDAQRNLGNVDAETSSKIASANSRVEQSYIALQFSAQKSLQTIQHDIQAVASANLGLESAEQRLATLQGRPPSEAAKKELEIKEAQLAVDKARQAVSDAYLKQQQNRAEASLKQAQLEQAASDAQLKRDTLLQESLSARIKAELAVKEAVTQREQADERAAQAALKNIPAITNAVQSIIGGQKAADQAIDVTKVKIEDLGKAIINAASVGGKKPEGMEVLIKLTEFLSSAEGKLINESTRLALVQQLGQQRMQQTGAAASELLNVLSRGSERFKDFNAKAEKLIPASAETTVEHFKDALTNLSYTIDLINRSLALSAMPTFTHLMEALQASLEKNDGLLHIFVDGIKAIGGGISTIIHWFEELFQWIDKTFNLEKGRSFQIFLAVLVTTVAAFASAWLAVPAAIAVVVTAVGYLASRWEDIKKAASEAWKSIKENSVVQFIQSIIDKVKELWEWWKKLGLAKAEATTEKGKSVDTGGGATQPDNAAPTNPGFATGGPVRGPGGPTSDSIPARLSNGEFVMNANAVATFGESFMHAINNATWPGFASGGLVSPSPRPGAGMGAPAPQSVLNLSIDGNHFPGLRGNKNVVDSLAAYAVGRQTSAAGRQPSWKS